jgi:hypothetical protein
MPTRTTRWTWILVLLLLLLVTWQWTSRTRQITRLNAEHATRLNDQVEALTRWGGNWAGAVADHSAQSIFHAFAAGIQPAVLAGRSDSLQQAKAQILQVPEVSFVHVIRPDGVVLMSSDDKYSTTGKAEDERATWALSATGLVTRQGAVAGTVEIAAPIVGSTGPRAVLWMGIKRQSLLDSARPKLPVE